MSWRIAIALGAACVCGGFGGCASTDQKATSRSTETVVPLGRVAQEPPLRLAPYGSNPKAKQRSAVISLLWDEVNEEATIVVKGMSLDLNELKDWLYPISRAHVDLETKLSNLNVVIRCDRDVPFEHVQRIMQTCANRDIMAPNISLAVESRLSTPLPTDNIPADPDFEDTRYENRIRIALRIREDFCICFVDGRAVAPLPEDKAKLVARLKALKAKKRTLVEIDPGNVAHHYVIDTIECCRRAKLKDVTFTAALPPVQKKPVQKKDGKPGK